MRVVCVTPTRDIFLWRNSIAQNKTCKTWRWCRCVTDRNTSATYDNVDNSWYNGRHTFDAHTTYYSNTNYNTISSLLYTFRRHRCPHEPEPDHNIITSSETTTVDNVSAYTRDFIDQHITDVTQVRTPIKRPTDNLKPEGDFQRPEKTEFRPAERPTQVRPEDNLHPEGDFQRPEKTEFQPAERPVQKRPQDNLRPEGEFERPQKPGFTPSQRPTAKRPEDNLHPEGVFERPEKTEFKPAERPTQVRPHDNLHPEGDFERPEKTAFKPAERPTQKIPKDNLRPEGEFYTPEKPTFAPAERVSGVKPTDNLTITGDFYGKIDIIKHLTNRKINVICLCRYHHKSN